MGLFADIVTPCIPVLTRLERTGLPLDVDLRARFRQEATDRLEQATVRTLEIVAQYHAKRLQIIGGCISGLEASVETAKQRAAADCHEHPDYFGFTKRGKCPGCAEVFRLNQNVRETVQDGKRRIAKGRVKLKQVGPLFQVDNDNHWRWLLFEKEGLGLEPVSFTDKKKLPQVDDDAIEKLQARHPTVEALRLRVEAKKSYSRLTRALGMELGDDGIWRSVLEPDPRGRVHFSYSLHRTGTGRIASGKDDAEDDKLRASDGGNAQNISDRDRRMYVAENGKILLSPDWSQIEVRDMAWLARETEMLRAWARGEDIHAINGAALAHGLASILPIEDCWHLSYNAVTPETADEVEFWFAGEMRSFRYAAKRMTHGWDYGMSVRKTSEMYGLPIEVAARLRAAYFSRWRRLARFQEEEYQRAAKDGRLRNAFGRVLRFYNYELRQGEWVLTEREEALAFRPQSEVGDMCKAVLPEVENIAVNFSGELLTTTHDSFLLMLPAEEARVNACGARLRECLEREWPELGEIEGFGKFKCPIDLALGYNWGKFHPEENPDGLRKIKGPVEIPPRGACSGAALGRRRIDGGIQRPAEVRGLSAAQGGSADLRAA